MVVFKIRESVPSARYSPVCNVLRQWKTSLIPTYRVYRLYDTNNTHIYMYKYIQYTNTCTNTYNTHIHIQVHILKTLRCYKLASWCVTDCMNTWLLMTLCALSGGMLGAVVPGRCWVGLATLSCPILKPSLTAPVPG